MKKCEKCERLYDESLENCPFCNKTLFIPKLNILILSNIIVLIIAIILVFINIKLSIFFALSFLILAAFISIKYKKELDEIKQSENKKIQTKQFSVIHLGGLKFTNQNESIILRISDKFFCFENKRIKSVTNIELSEIENIQILEDISYEQKEKSVIGRAIAGGLLFGPAGAIVGGLSGLNPNIQENKDYFIEIKLKNNESIFLTSGIKTLKKVSNLIISRVSHE